MQLALVAAVASLLAPGRVVLPVDDFRPDGNPDIGGGAHTVMRANGEAQILRDGALERLDRTGRAGSRTRAALPPGARVKQLLVHPHGYYQALVEVPPLSRYETEQLQVVNIESFRGGKVTPLGIQVGCGACDSAVMAQDGSIFVAGTTGQVDPSIETNPSAPNSFRWTVVKLTPAQEIDTSFGDAGIVTLPVESAHGFGVALLDDGRIATYGQAGTAANYRLHLARLTADGKPDPTFNGGVPLRTELSSGFAWLVHGDGTVDLHGGPPDRIVRYRPDGSIDRETELPGVSIVRLLPEPGDGVAAFGSPRGEPWTVLRIRPGQAPARRTLDFGGGIGTRLSENSHGDWDVFPRPDGSYLISGGVGVVRYTGEGAGRSVSGAAFTSLTPDLQLDPGFGGEAAPRRVSVSVPRQRRGRGAVSVLVRTGTPAQVRLRIRVGGRLVGEDVAPILSSRRERVTVRVPRRLRGRTVVVQARMRDLVGVTASATARGRLR